MTIHVIPAKLVLDLIGERESIGEWGTHPLAGCLKTPIYVILNTVKNLF